MSEEAPVPEIKKHRLEQYIDLRAEVDAHTIDGFEELTEAEDFVVGPYLNSFEEGERIRQNAKIKTLLKDRTIFEAQALYMRYTPLLVIARETGLGIRLLQRFIGAPGGWREQREKIHTEITEAVKRTALSQLVKATELTLYTIIQGLEGFQDTLKEEKRAASLQETVMMTTIYNQLHKAKITEEITDPNKGKAPPTPKEMVDAFGADPYLMKSIEAAKENRKLMCITEEALEQPSNPDTGSLAHPER